MSRARDVANLGSDTTNLEDISSAYNAGALSNRNKIINGAMTIDQRNAGASVTPADGAFITDRWKVGVSQASKFTAQQSSTAPTGFAKSLLITSSSAYSIVSGDYFNFQQRIEGNNVSDLAWGTSSAKTITLSFWVRSSLTGTFGGAVSNSASDRSYPFTYSISVADTWEQKAVTIVGDTSGTWVTTNGIGMLVSFGFGVGSTYSGTAGAWAAAYYLSATGATSVVGTSGATFYITGVQLEAGSVATPFEHRSYGQELALCQRYLPSTFLRTANNILGPVQALSNTVGLAFIPWNVTPRVPPTGVSASAAGDFYVTNPASSTAFTASALAFEVSSNLGGYIRVTHANNSASAGNMVGFYSNTSGAAILWTGCEL